MVKPDIGGWQQMPPLTWIAVIAMLALGLAAFAFGFRVRIGKR